MKKSVFYFILCSASFLWGQWGNQPSIDRKEILKKKIDTFIPSALKDNGIDCWLVFTRENAKDPIAADLGGGGAVARMALLFAWKDGKFLKKAICASYDVTPPTESGIYDEIISYRGEGIKPHLQKMVKELNPKTIGVNISRDETLADGLTAGMKNYLLEVLGIDFEKRMVSAENIIVSFRGKKLPEELSIIEKAVQMTQEILAASLTSEVVQSGKTTESDLAAFLESKTKSMGATVAFNSVTVGVSRGHSSPKENIIQKGDLIRLDFGIDYLGYKTDIQRTAYVLKEGETKAPEYIQKMWEITKKANREAVNAMKPGAPANDADRIARKIITDAGYLEYPHAAGHPIGFEVHDAGAIPGPDWKERYGSKVWRKLEVGQTFAVEPIVYAADPVLKGEINIGLEEDVVIEKSGARYLGNPQENLILFK